MSADFICCIAVMLYVATGIFVGAILDGDSPSSFFGLSIFFWPVIIGVLLLFIMMLIPFKLGLWVRGKFDIQL